MMSANSNVPKTLFKDIRKGDYLDAHAWVECECCGKAIDPHFDSYDKICELRDLDINQQAYKEFDPMVQKLCWELMKPRIGPIEEWMKKKGQEVLAADKDADFVGIDFEPQAGCCFMNAYLEWLCSGKKGVLKCGSMGWKEKSGDSVHWEFG
jgi:hypothetical protein